MALNTRIQTKRDTAANWETKNPVLLDGEMIIVITNAGDTRFKIGDGTKTYTQLPFQDESLYNALSGKADAVELDAKQDKLTGTEGQIVGFDSNGDATAQDMPSREIIVEATSTDGVNYTATVPDITELTTGIKITVVPSMTSTSTSIKLNVNGLGNTPIKARRFMNTSASTTGLSDNWFESDYPITLMYNGMWWVTTDFGYAHASYLYGTVPVKSGGTGQVSLTAGSYLVGNGTGNVTMKTPSEVLSDIGAQSKITGTPGDFVVIGTDGSTTTKAIDTTLSVAGKAADAKAVGDAIAEVNDNIPDSLSELTDDSTHRTVTDTEKATWNAKSNFSGNYNDLTNKPTIPSAYTHPSYTAKSSGLYKVTVDATGHVSAATAVTKSDITGLGIPAQDTVYTHPDTHPASMITGLATVATSGSYNDLSNKPTIPSAYTHPSTHAASMITGLATVATSGSYNDLTNKPTIPAAYSHPTSHPASMISAGTFAGEVVAYSSGQTYSNYCLRNTRLASSDTNPTVNGQICWTYG